MNFSIASVASDAPSSNTTAGVQANGLGSFDSGAFMTLLLAELKNQNPLEPMDDKDMMAQMTQMNSLSELQGIKSALDNMVVSNEFIYASSLIGKTVKADFGQGKTIEGAVTGLTQVNGSLMLQIGDTDVPISAITEVKGG